MAEKQFTEGQITAIVMRIEEAYDYVGSTLDISEDLGLQFSQNTYSRLRALKSSAESLISRLGDGDDVAPSQVKRFFKLYDAARESLNKEDIGQRKELRSTAKQRNQRSLAHPSAGEVFSKKLEGVAQPFADAVVNGIDEISSSGAFRELSDKLPTAFLGPFAPILSDINKVTGVGDMTKWLGKKGKALGGKLFSKGVKDESPEVRATEALSKELSRQNEEQSEELEHISDNTDPENNFFEEEESRDAQAAQHKENVDQQTAMNESLTKLVNKDEGEEGDGIGGFFKSIGSFLINPLRKVGRLLKAGALALGAAFAPLMASKFGKTLAKIGKMLTGGGARAVASRFLAPVAAFMAGKAAFKTGEDLNSMSPEQIKDYGGGIENDTGAFAAAFTRKLFNNLFGDMPQKLYEWLSTQGWYDKMIDALVAFDSDAMIEKYKTNSAPFWDTVFDAITKTLPDAFAGMYTSSMNAMKKIIDGLLEEVGNVIGPVIDTLVAKVKSGIQALTDAIIAPFVMMGEVIVQSLEDNLGVGAIGKLFGIEDTTGNLIKALGETGAINDKADIVNTVGGMKDTIDFDKLNVSDASPEQLRRLSRTSKLDLSDKDRQTLMELAAAKQFSVKESTLQVKGGKQAAPQMQMAPATPSAGVSVISPTAPVSLLNNPGDQTLGFLISQQTMGAS